MLVKNAGAAKKRTVADADMTAEETIVGDDDVVPNFAVVTDVRPGHEKIVVADFGDAALGAAAVDGAMLANHIFVSNRDVGLAFRRKGKVLRRAAENCAVPDQVGRADRDTGFNDNVRFNGRSFADDDIPADHGVRSDRDVSPDLRRWIDDRRWMNFHSTPASLKLK